MKFLVILFIVLTSYNFVQAQEIKSSLTFEPKKLSEFETDYKEVKTKNKFNFLRRNETKQKKSVREMFSFEVEITENSESTKEDKKVEVKESSLLEPAKDASERKPDFGKFLAKPPPKKKKEEEKFHWKPALLESFYFLAIQHSFRLFQEKTTREFGGKFFKEWGKSVRNLGGWRDGDGFVTNYIAHPMQGAVTGRIFVNNSDKSKKLEFGRSKEYWESRLKAMIWSAAWSTQFELGPISEASIGNVGLYDDTGPNLMGWVDIVVTPTVGTATLIGEDIIDKYVLRKWLERKTKSRTRIKLYRTFLTPFQSFANILRGKAPWKRDNR